MTYKKQRDLIASQMEARNSIHKMMSSLFEGAILTNRDNQILREEVAEFNLLRRRVQLLEREREDLKKRVRRLDRSNEKWQRYAMTFAEVIYDYEEDGFKVPAKIKKMMEEST